MLLAKRTDWLFTKSTGMLLAMPTDWLLTKPFDMSFSILGNISTEWLFT